MAQELMIRVAKEHLILCVANEMLTAHTCSTAYIAYTMPLFATYDCDIICRYKSHEDYRLYANKTEDLINERKFPSWNLCNSN